MPTPSEMLALQEIMAGGDARTFQPQPKPAYADFDMHSPAAMHGADPMPQFDMHSRLAQVGAYPGISGVSPDQVRPSPLEAMNYHLQNLNGRGMQDQYNTPLTGPQNMMFPSWLNKVAQLNKRTPDSIYGDRYNYDVQGQFASGQTPQGHGSDFFKKPNHPTFSMESLYDHPNYEGGKWTDSSFTPGSMNYEMSSPDHMRQYFNQAEIPNGVYPRMSPYR